MAKKEKITWRDEETLKLYREIAGRAKERKKREKLENTMETYVKHPTAPDFPIIFRHFTFCNNYEGYIGRFFINAVFEKGPLVTTLSC